MSRRAALGFAIVASLGCAAKPTEVDGHRLAAGGDETVRIWSIDDLRRDGTP